MRIPVEQLVETYKDNLFAVSFNICKNPQDAEDIVQDTFLKYMKSKKEFQDEEHIKAWLIRVAVNQSKDMILSFWRRNKTPLEEYMQELPFETNTDSQVLEAVLGLPRKYRVALHLFYYEEYSIREISKILGVRENTVKSQLARGRRLLKEQLREVWNENE